MRASFGRILVTLAVGTAVAGSGWAQAQPPATYTLGGVSCAAAPANFGFYCFDGGGFIDYRAAVQTAANFGAGGVVPTAVTTVAVSAFTAADLAGIDGLVIPWWSTADAGANAGAVRDFFLAGGDLFILADNPGNDAVNAVLDVPTLYPSVAAGPTTGTAPLYAGPFGTVVTATQFLTSGRLDPAAVTFRRGHIAGTNAAGEPMAAVWDRNEYAPGAGRLVIVTDVDMLVGFGRARYEPPATRNDNGRFGLNATSFLVTGGTIDPITYDLIGVPSCAITPRGFDAYCGVDTVLGPLAQAVRDPATFGPAGPVQRRVAFTELDTLTPDLLAHLTAVVMPWVHDADAAPYAATLRDYFLAGGNLWLLQDDFLHDPIGHLLGVPTASAFNSPPRPTNGTAPVYDGPFGIASDVLQWITVGNLDANDVAARGGTIVGTATDGSGDTVAAAWDRGDYAPGAGRMVIATDVDAVFLPNSPPANRTWALNTIAFLVTGGRYDGVAPTLTCAASPDTLWPPSGLVVPVTVSGSAIDQGSGLDPATVSYSVSDEYGLVQPAGPIGLDAGGTFSVEVPLVTRRFGFDLDGRTYTITVTARDIAGNTASCTATATVRHDQRR